jgi:WD40 repeat protein
MTSALLPPHAFTNKFTFGEPRLHTDGEILAISFGKEGWLYTVEELGILRKWNAESGQQLDWFSLSDMETLWAFSADAQVLASASDDLTIWDASSGRLLTSIAQPGWVTALAFGPDASFVATGHDDGSIGYWDAPGHHSVFDKCLTYHKGPVSAVAISPNGKMLAAASEDKTISVWDLSTGKYFGCLAGHTDRIPALAWHSSGRFLVSVGWDTTARVWDASTLEPVILFNSHATQVNALAFSRDGRWLACADSTQTIHVWDFDKRKTLHKLKISYAESRKPAFKRERRERRRPGEPVLQTEIGTLAFSPDGKYLACNGDRVIHLWSPETGKPYSDRGSRPLGKTTVSIRHDGSRLISNGGGTEVRIWDVTTRKAIITLPSEEPILALAFSPDGKSIAGSLRDEIRLWDANGQFVADWHGPEEPVTTLAFSPDSTLLASGSDRGDTVWIWRVADGQPILLIPDALNGCSIESLAFLPDNKNLAVGGIDRMETSGKHDGAVSIWNLPERAEITTFVDGTTALAIHPSGDILASATLDHSICMWDLQLKQLLQELIGHDGAVTCLAFSPDGNWLVSGSDDHTLRIWDTKGREQMALEVESLITSVTFSADGQFLYTGHANTTCSQIQLLEPFRPR